MENLKKRIMDQPYLETMATITENVLPDEIYIGIDLSEEEVKGNITIEKLEAELDTELRGLGINPSKDMILVDYKNNVKSSFMKGGSIKKTKNYQLRITDAVVASHVLRTLPKKGIGSLKIEKAEYTKEDELMLRLRKLAVEKAKRNAISLTEPLNQEVGKAIYISDTIDRERPAENNEILRQAKTSLPIPASFFPVEMDFKSIKYKISVVVRFEI